MEREGRSTKQKKKKIERLLAEMLSDW